ncbi:hypothetical protein PAMP_005545 [Pampus punctatissimus]
MIKCLPKEVQGKLRSGVAIPSLQQCLEELILNSIDAGATCVGVRMDMEAFKLQVIDNGAGINAEDMQCVGNRYYTSKCSSVEDLDNLRFYGFRGEAIASIVSLATLVEISSRTRSSVKTLGRIFKDGKGLDVFEAETARPSAGTTVVICNFFHNMPVRRRRMDAVLEGERIRHRVEAISLMHPSVSFTLKNDCTGAMMVQLPKARNTYHRFVQIHTLGRAQKLGEISYSCGQFEVSGYIGREGHYNNSLQFLYVNDRLLLKTRIHKLLNFLLRRLSSSNQKTDGSSKQKRSQDLHGVYIINIKCSYSEYDICLEPAKTLIEFKDWDEILLCIEETVKAFLSRENLVSQDDSELSSEIVCESPKLFGTDQEGNRSDKDEETISASTSVLDCTVGVTLASESVHRKHKDHVVCLEAAHVGCEEDNEEQPEQKRITANELENTQSEGFTDKESRDEPQCDLAGLEPSDNQLTVRDAPTFSEGSPVSCMSSSVRQLEDEQEELSKGKEIKLNCTALTSNLNSLNSVTQEIIPDSDSIKEILLDFQSTGGHVPTLISNRKISLCNPYSHESLQINRRAFQQQDPAVKCEERSFASKRKISLNTDHNRSCEKVFRDFAPVIPSKISKISSAEKMSLCKESGSLDKFRRIYGKCDEPSLGICLKNNAKLPQNPQNLLVSKKDRQQRDVTETQEEPRSSFRSTPSLSGFTRLKQIPPQTLAAKLCRLNQHSTGDVKTSLHLSRCTSQDSTSLSSIQDSNNNPCDAALDADAVADDNTDPQLEREVATATGDWLHHYDTSVGKTVYVNKVTGLSRYDDPPTEEMQVRCTSDVTNMAVSVISEIGDGGESSNSLSSLYSKWNNPVFVHPPTVGVDISSEQADGLAVKIHNILFPYRFSKAMIPSMKVIHQVDKKFLACLINTRDEESAANTETEGNLLVLLDQHAAHERVRLENLVADSYEDDPDAPGQRRLCSSTIFPPLEISVTEEELRLLRSCRAHLQSLGLEVNFSLAADLVLVGKVPMCFMEKESNELRRGRPSVIKPIVEEYLREQTELLRSAGRVRGALPLTVLKVLASLACHGAIKFNDRLNRDECCSLVASLSSCQLPFQCAHGRPSIAPLVDILHLDTNQKELQKPNLRKLRRMYKAWELYGNR